MWSRVIHIFANMRACVSLVVVMAVMVAVMVGGGAQMSTTHMSHSLPIGLFVCLFLFSSTMRFSRHGLGASGSKEEEK